MQNLNYYYQNTTTVALFVGYQSQNVTFTFFPLSNKLNKPHATHSSNYQIINLSFTSFTRVTHTLLLKFAHNRINEEGNV